MRTAPTASLFLQHLMKWECRWWLLNLLFAATRRRCDLVRYCKCVAITLRCPVLIGQWRSGSGSCYFATGLWSFQCIHQLASCPPIITRVVPEERGYLQCSGIWSGRNECIRPIWFIWGNERSSLKICHMLCVLYIHAVWLWSVDCHRCCMACSLSFPALALFAFIFAACQISVPPDLA